MLAQFFSTRGFAPTDEPLPKRLNLGLPAPRSLGMPVAFLDQALSQLSTYANTFCKVAVGSEVVHVLHVDDQLKVTVLIIADGDVTDTSVIRYRRTLARQLAAVQSLLNADDCTMQGFVVSPSGGKLLTEPNAKDVKALSEAHGLVGGSKLEFLRSLVVSTPSPRAEQIRGMVAAAPQLDAVRLRVDGTLVFGILEGFQEAESATTITIQRPAPAASSPVRALERVATRTTVCALQIENATGGVVGMPMALASGALGWTPLARVNAMQRPGAAVNAVASVDVPPLTRVVFRGENEAVLTLTLNDVAELRLAGQLRAASSGALGVDSRKDVFDSVGSLVGTAVASGLRSGVVNALPGIPGGGITALLFGEAKQ